MTAAIKCMACSRMNPLGRLFCVGCGERLDTKNIVDVPLVSPAKRITRLVRLLVLLGLLLALLQMIRPVAPMGRQGAPDAHSLLLYQLETLRQAVLNKRSMEMAFTEASINGYLHHLLTNSPSRESSGPVKAEVQDVRVQLLPGQVVVVMTSSLGPFTISYETQGQPRVAAEGFVFDVERVRIGHLPLPGPAAPWAASRLFNLFSELERERTLANAVDQITVDAGQVRVRTGAP